MGMADAKTALGHENVNLVAVCDLYDGRIDEAKVAWGRDLFVTKDHREVLKREDVDAVIIATPDHWHKTISIEALKAGKHVYCEKPMVHSIGEGHEVIRAWRKSKKVYQVGSQGLSSLGNEKARQLLGQEFSIWSLAVYYSYGCFTGNRRLDQVCGQYQKAAF